LLRGEPRVRLRFFLAYLASWTVVGMFATLFASVGVAADPILSIDVHSAKPEILPQYANGIYPCIEIDTVAGMVSRPAVRLAGVLPCLEMRRAGMALRLGDVASRQRLGIAF
jgi:hypothetical protein